MAITIRAMKTSFHRIAFAATLFGAFFATFTSSGVAQAMPTLGDDVVFSSVTVNASAVVTGTFEMTLTAFDSTAQTWTESQITTQNGVAKTENQQISSSALLTDSGVQTILTGCVGMGGTLQKLTVPLGTFSTCAIPSKSDFSNGTLWVAAGVAFGIVQEDFTQTDGTHTVLQLVSQTLGH
jgi:hypothetical protein